LSSGKSKCGGTKASSRSLKSTVPPETVALLEQGLCDYTTQVGRQISYMLGAALLPSQICAAVVACVAALSVAAPPVKAPASPAARPCPANSRSNVGPLIG